MVLLVFLPVLMAIVDGSSGLLIESKYPKRIYTDMTLEAIRMLVSISCLSMSLRRLSTNILNSEMKLPSDFVTGVLNLSSLETIVHMWFLLLVLDRLKILMASSLNLF